jgi:capsular exopolysaccharide synthesis family protein
MELRQYFAVIWRWLWLIVLGTLLAGGTAYLVSRNMIPIYRASSTLLISEARDPGVVDYSVLQTSERLAKTYAERFTKRPVLEEVSARLGLDIGADEFAVEIAVSPVRDTQLIELNVESSDPQLAMDIANILPEVFIERNTEMQLSRFASSKENLSKQLALIESDMEATQQAINDLQDSDSAADQTELARLQTILTQHQSNYASLLSSYEDIRLAEIQSIDNIIVDEPAELPDDPIKPRKLQNTLLAAVVGCMLAVGVAFLIEYRDDTIKSSEDVSQALGLSTLGVITRFHSTDDQDRLITAAHPRSPISEAYRALRTNIQFSTVDKPLRTLLVTSVNPVEGKTTTVANLGTVMAQAGLSVIVVDSDLRRPALHQSFEVSRNLGLTNALLDKNPNPDGYLQTTEVENLRVLACGPLPPNPSELLNSQRMKELIEQLEKEADVLLFDSPPILAVTDASILANQVDGVLLVVDSGTTRRAVAQRGGEQLDKVGANVLGVALNKLSRKGAGGYYYYYYYYSSEDDGERREKQGRKRSRRETGVVGAIKRWVARLPLLGHGG